MRVLIVANGEVAAREQIPAQYLSAEMVIAVDGGWDHCQALDLNADIVMGDFDSIPGTALQVLQESDMQLIQYPSEKDETDLELALTYAVEQGASQISILGGLGGRFDMTMANISLLLHPQLLSTPIEFWHLGQRIWLIQPPGDEIPGEIGDTLSLLPFGSEAYGIRTKNLVYPLENDHLQWGLARGVSNVLSAETATVSLESGALLAIWTKGRA